MNNKFDNFFQRTKHSWFDLKHKNKKSIETLKPQRVTFEISMSVKRKISQYIQIYIRSRCTCNEVAVLRHHVSTAHGSALCLAISPWRYSWLEEAVQWDIRKQGLALRWPFPWWNLFWEKCSWRVMRWVAAAVFPSSFLLSSVTANAIWRQKQVSIR